MTITSRPGLALSPDAKFFSRASVQPVFLRAFGQDTALSQVTRNMIPGGAPASLIGTPTIDSSGLTCTPNNGAGLLLPVVSGQPVTAFIVASCPTFNASTPALGQLLGNFHPFLARGGVVFDFTETQFSGYIGNLYGNTVTNQNFAAPSAPLNPKLYIIQYTPNNGASPSAATIALGNLTDSAGLAASTYAGDLTNAAGGGAALQLGTYPQTRPGFTAPVRFNFISVTAGILSKSDIVFSARQIQKLMPIYGGVRV